MQKEQLQEGERKLYDIENIFNPIFVLQINLIAEIRSCTQLCAWLFTPARSTCGAQHFNLTKAGNFFVSHL